MRHTREKVKSILVNWWKKPTFNSHLATISHHDKNIYIYIYIDYLTMLIARMNSIRIVVWGLGYAIRYNKLVRFSANLPDV